jgi:lipocalin-like protein
MEPMKSLAVVFILWATVAAADDAASVRQRLLGNWALVKYEVISENGDVRPGNYDVGRLMYGEGGEMTAHLARSDRTAYLGYFGPYTIDAAKGVVVHHVVGSSLASWVGSEQVRYYGFTADGRLTLSLKQGVRVTQTLTWERVPSR